MLTIHSVNKLINFLIVFGAVLICFSCSGRKFGAKQELLSSSTGGYLYEDSILDVAIIDQTVFAISQNGLSISRDEGKTWERYSKLLNTTLGGMFNMANEGNSVCLATLAGLFISLDKGVSWTRVTSSGIKAGATHVTSCSYSNNVLVATLAINWFTKIGFSYSLDNGISWTYRSYPSSVDFSDFVMSVLATPNNWYISRGDGNRPYETSADFGVTRASSVIADLSPAYEYVNSMVLVGSDIWFATTKGLFVSIDDGVNWTKYDSGGGVYYNEFGFINSFGTKIIAGDSSTFNNKHVILSLDSGGTFVDLSSNLNLSSTVNLKNGAISNTQIVLATTDGLRISNDNGSTWYKVNKKTNEVPQ